MSQPSWGAPGDSGGGPPGDPTGSPSVAPTGSPLPDPVYGHPMSIFLSDRYRKLCLFGLKGEEERRERAEMLQQLRAQRAVEGFLRDGCLVRAATMGVGGGILGTLNPKNYP